MRIWRIKKLTKVDKTSADPLFEPVLSRTRVYDGKYLHLDRLQVRLPDQSETDREVVVVRDAVAVLPLEPDGTVHLIRQHRPAIGKTLIEVPAGLLDENESPLEAARRECEEETGYRPECLIPLITYAHAEGYSTGFVTLYLGKDLIHTGQIRLDRTEFIEPLTMSLSDLLALIKDQKIFDSKTILCALLANAYLKNTW